MRIDVTHLCNANDVADQLVDAGIPWHGQAMGKLPIRFDCEEEYIGQALMYNKESESLVIIRTLSHLDCNFTVTH